MTAITAAAFAATLYMLVVFVAVTLPVLAAAVWESGPLGMAVLVVVLWSMAADAG